MLFSTLLLDESQRIFRIFYNVVANDCWPEKSTYNPPPCAEEGFEGELEKQSGHAAKAKKATECSLVSCKEIADIFLEKTTERVFSRMTAFASRKLRVGISALLVIPTEQGRLVLYWPQCGKTAS